MKNWLPALCAAVLVVVGTGCGEECVDQFDCVNKKGPAPEGQRYVCQENKCSLENVSAPTPPPDAGVTCSPACSGATPICDISSGAGVCKACTSNEGCAADQVCDTAANSGVGVCVPVPSTTSGQIATFLSTDAGTLDAPLPVEAAYVTYTKPAVGTEAAGFFLQAEPEGPAMFVSVADAGTEVQVGDRVSLAVTEKAELSGVRTASAVQNLTVLSQNHPVQNLATATPPGLAVDRSSADDLVTNLDSYESELISLTGTLASAPAGAGSGHSAFQVTTAGMMTPASNFRLRVPTTLVEALDLAEGCGFTLKAGPMWRFNTNAQPSAYNASDLMLSGCPAPKLLQAGAESPTSVQLLFDRNIKAESVEASDFTIPTLNITNAQVDGKAVRLTTERQVPGTTYTVTVTGVEDQVGTTIDPAANSASFIAYNPLAVHGARLELTGEGIGAATAVTIGGEAQTFTAISDTRLAIPSVSDATPLGTQPVVVTTPSGDVSLGDLPVARLLINELDSDMTGTDAAEFIELSTGVPGLSLAGTNFVLVFFNGSNDLSYYAIDLNRVEAVADANGLILIGNTLVTPAPAITFADNFLQNGADAVALYQGTSASFPNNTPVTAENLIDAVVYETNDADDTGLLDVLLGTGTNRVQVDESVNNASATESIQRCGLARRDGSIFVVTAPTPGAANTCP